MKNLNDFEFVRMVALRVQSFGGRTFYVGGCVRDRLLGIAPKDVDIEIYGITPDVLVSDILSTFGQVRFQGASFGVYRVADYDVDIALPRTENVVGKSHKDFKVYVDSNLSFEKATARRDFTINAMLQDVLTREIIDVHGGQDDLKNGIIRHVNATSFVEDALRVFRAAQFAARFDFTIAADTKYLMRTIDTMFLSKERVYGELKKALLLSYQPSRFFEELRDVNQLDFWFPEILAMYGCGQNPVYHPEGDVWTHTMQMLDFATVCRGETAYPEQFMLAVLCHDIGKPISSHTGDDGVIHAYYHDTDGVAVGRTFLRRITNNNFTIRYVTNMIEHHMKLPQMFSHNSRYKKTNALLDKSICTGDLMLLSYCDIHNKELCDNMRMCAGFLKWCQERIDIYNYIMGQPQVTGNDLMLLGLHPSVLFSKLLKEAHKLHLSGIRKDEVLRGFQTKLRKQKKI